MGATGGHRDLRRHRGPETDHPAREDGPLPAPARPDRGRRERTLDQRGRTHPDRPGGALPADATLVDSASGSCADLPHSSTAPGTEPTLYTCHGGPNQRWTLQGDGHITGLGGVCLDATNAAAVTVQPCAAVTGQTWQPGDDGSLRNSGQCLTPEGSATANGTRLTRTACAGTPAQRWTFTP
ncbi:RICIN domain-containing protein [Streptomyces cirratus]|uniref:RICIN domain-containing protein n=1 Tax=Streptomyces cirratus TaxID=68187 RepID=UPI00360C2A03